MTDMTRQVGLAVPGTDPARAGPVGACPGCLLRAGSGNRGHAPVRAWRIWHWRDGRRCEMRVSGGGASSVAPVAYLALAAVPTAPFWARCQTRLVLDWWGISPETIETAMLLVSELVTNAARIVGPATSTHHAELFSVDQISLTMQHLGRALRIEVADPDPHIPVLANADLDAERGRGLMIVAALSSEWSYFFPPSGGKVVYCVIELAESPREGE
jgi:Histidine kinase-like ATPase domain